MPVNMMGGWKTWIAVAGTVLLGISDIYEGRMDAGVQKFVAAMALAGVGHKLDKTGGK